VIKPRRLGWAGNVARVGAEVRCIQDFGGGESEGKRPLAGPRRRCSKYTSKEPVQRACTELIWLRIGIYGRLYQINTDRCTHMLLNHHFINTYVDAICFNA
jgi:hypothetical protein